jgi:hypothetical protein
MERTNELDTQKIADIISPLSDKLEQLRSQAKLDNSPTGTKPFPTLEEFDMASYHKALENWAKEAEKYIAALEHYVATTEGLWATDREDAIIDKSLFWQLNYNLTGG